MSKETFMARLKDMSKRSYWLGEDIDSNSYNKGWNDCMDKLVSLVGEELEK